MKRFAFQALAAGHKRLGIATIWERIRWYSAIETTGKPFKLSNNHRAYYARMFMADYPEHDGFFELKPTFKDLRERRQKSEWLKANAPRETPLLKQLEL